ncbi:hypothetical protein [Streptomyces sp. NPDC088727]|uniref:hypothetical protein n=1 Tax=Streptomyces sp. NPDC088727 TaxID=3365875 RepID=UPI00382CC1C5
MPRLEPTAKKKTATKKTAAQQRAERALAASQASSALARRGEGDDTLTEAATAAASAPSEVSEPAEPAKQEAYIPHQDAIVKASEEGSPFQFVKPSPGDDPLTQMGAARRGIARANRGLANGLGALQRDYVASAGEYLWWATQGSRLKDAGFKSIEKFAEPLDLTKQDVYRLRRAVPIYRIIGDMVGEALNERTIRELYKTIVDEKGDVAVTEDGEPDVSPERQKDLRAQFDEMKRMGRVNSGGAVAARRLLMLGEQTGPIETEPGGEQRPGAVDQVTKARRTNRILPLEVLREAKDMDPEAAQGYVNDLRRAWESAAEIVG